jgi:hypothetical protein
VVFGGWASTTGPQEPCNLLAYHDPWRCADIIDLHHQSNGAFVICYERYAAGGKGRGIWQPEKGWRE